jgi:Domain of unknown function (DUF4168)
MMASHGLRLLVVLGALTTLPSPAASQGAPDTTITAAALEAFAKAHLAVSGLRAQVQAELADPKAKKPEEQAALREKLQVNTRRLIAAQGLTEAEFARMTRRVSTDDVLRKAFEAALARLGDGKPPS